MKRLEIDPERLDPRRVFEAVEVLHDGGVVAYPTDTVYALGCALDAKRAVERIYRAKRMEAHQRMALICPDVSTAASYASLSREAFTLARRIFPGPYTLVLPATREVPRTLLDKRRRQVGIRIPAHPIAHALVSRLGRPLLTTSAVPPGQTDACANADAVADAFAHDVDLLIDGGTTPGVASTVIEATDEGFALVRRGLGDIDLDQDLD